MSEQVLRVFYRDLMESEADTIGCLRTVDELFGVRLARERRSSSHIERLKSYRSCLGPKVQDDCGVGQTSLKTIGYRDPARHVHRIVLFEAFEIEGPSMEPTLLNGDRGGVCEVLVRSCFFPS